MCLEQRYQAYVIQPHFFVLYLGQEGMQYLKDKLFELTTFSKFKQRSNKAEQVLCSGRELENKYGFAQR
jgi:hypothetical protein